MGGLLGGALVAAFVTGAVAVPAARGATIAPNTLADPDFPGVAACSLRIAVETANDNAANFGCAHPGGAAVDDLIQLGSGTYTLSKAGSADNANLTGDLDVIADDSTAGSLTIDGQGAAATSIDITATDRVIDLVSSTGGSLVLRDLTITGGDAAVLADSRGGGIRSQTGVDVTLEAVTVTGNDADFGGGGIEFGAGAGDTLAIEDSTIAGNDVAGALIGVLTGGGGIRTSANLIVTDSTIADNTVTDTDAGAGVPTVGGGIRLSTAAAGVSLAVDDSTIVDNSVTVQAPNVADTPTGGGIAASGSDLRITGSLVSGNTLIGGTNRSGAGIVYDDNSQPVDAMLENSTVSGNDAGPATSLGGGFNLGATSMARFANLTFSGNSASIGRALRLNPTSTATSRGTIFSQGGSGACVMSPGTFISHGHNVDQGESCELTAGTDRQNGNPALAPLAANGGPTLTHALGPASDALNLIPRPACRGADGATPLTQDQRGRPRPFPAGGGCDAGAYELQKAKKCLGKRATVMGTQGNDVLAGTSGRDVFVALGGRDRIKGRGGADRLCGGAGRDKLRGSGGRDRMVGGAGRDNCDGGLPATGDRARGCERVKRVP